MTIAFVPDATPVSSAEAIAYLREAMPQHGLFRGKEWLLSPEAFPLDRELVRKLERLGAATYAFQRACNRLYLLGVEGGLYSWVTQLLDQGKPQQVVELGREARWREDVPRVIRPDLILSESGVGIAELDSLPGGIGLTGWLGQTYASLGQDIVGGAEGMVQGFAAAYPGHDFLISRESGDYEPEMQWLSQQLEQREGSPRRVLHPWEIEPYELRGCDVYRFFELWDLDQVEQSKALLSMAKHGDLRFTPPLKAYLEEKLWLALFWSPALQAWWRTELSVEHRQLLQECIPQGWVLDPTPLPWHAEWPGLGIQSWQSMKKFGGRERELVLKVSGFSETAWGSRGVNIGHDLSQEQWAAVIDEALEIYPKNPHVLQRFTRARVFSHPVWDEARQQLTMMKARVRLCPYYFIVAGEARLGGVLATIVPADKKILHGMRDAAMVPCRLV